MPVIFRKEGMTESVILLEFSPSRLSHSVPQLRVLNQGSVHLVFILAWRAVASIQGAVNTPGFSMSHCLKMEAALVLILA